jgi:MFS family permease
MKLKHLHYGWVMVAISIGVLVTHGLAFYSFGVFLRPITEWFDWDRGALSAAMSVTILVAGGLSIVAGRLSDRYGPRPLVTIGGILTGIAFLLTSQINSLWHIYSIWGIFMGIGGSACFVPILSIIPRWFIKKRGIAVGLTMAGFGLGGIISPLLAQWLISAYGWRQAFIILGLITLIIITSLAQFMKHSPQRTGLKPYGGNEIIEDKQSQSSAMEELSFSQVIRTSRFWLFGLIQAGLFFCLGAIMVHIVPHATDIGIPEVIAASILSIAAGISIFGRLSIGFISDKIGGRLALITCLIVTTLALTWLLFAKEIWTFYVFAVIFGLAYGGIVTLLPVVAAELFGLESLGVILGGLTLLGTIGEAAGSPLSGSIFDITGSYWLAFLICIIICTVAVILSLVLLRYKGKTGMARE